MWCNRCATSLCLLMLSRRQLWKNKMLFTSVFLSPTFDNPSSTWFMVNMIWYFQCGQIWSIMVNIVNNGQYDQYGQYDHSKNISFWWIGEKLHWNLLEALPSKYHLHICSHDSNILEISRRRSILPASSQATDTFSRLKTTSSPSRMTQPVSTDFRLPWGNQICKHENNWQEWHANDFD